MCTGVFNSRNVRTRGVASLLLGAVLVSGCSSVTDSVAVKIDRGAVLEYVNYCARLPEAPINAQSYAYAGFAYVEQQCGIAFDKMTELTQFGRFSVKALTAGNLAASSIMQAAGIALHNVTIVSSAITFTEAAFNAFIEQYAFAPYLYKLRELTWQAFDAHKTENLTSLVQLRDGSSPDAYCMAYIFVQAHANICTISNLQQLFDLQVANATKVVKPVDKVVAPVVTSGGVPLAAIGQARRAVAVERAMGPRALRSTTGRPNFAPPVSPNFTVQ